MKDLDGHDALTRLRMPFGGLERTLAIGEWAFRLRGLDAALAADLDLRWGGFLAERPPAGTTPTCRVDLCDGGDRTWLGRPAPGETYRVEARVEDGRPVLRSYHFLAGPEEDRSGWRALVTRTDDEPVGRVVENVLRLLLARTVVRHGGVPFHAAGVVRDGRAHLLAGPSGAGKTTAVALSEPCIRLGDDFGFAVPGPEGWRTAAVPFDNAERVEAGPARGWFPLGGVWRLFQAEATRLETPSEMVRDLSILACAAAPWSMPELAVDLMDNVARLGREVPYGHLHFRPEPGLWDRIGPV